MSYSTSIACSATARSGKIMRRLLREIVTSDKVTGDITTLEDLSVINRLSTQSNED